MPAVFLETSALLQLIFGEEKAKEVEKSLRTADRIFASRLLKLETERVLLRAALEDRQLKTDLIEVERELRGLWSRIDFFEVTREIAEAAGRVAPYSRLRSLDAIHLATFESFRTLEPNLKFLSYDKRILAEL